MKPIRVLLTDPDYRHTLGALRCLGRHGVECHVVSYHPGVTLAGASRYCRSTTFLGLIDDEAAFLDGLLALLQRTSFDVLLPISLGAHRFMVKYGERLRPLVAVPVAGESAFAVAANKRETFRLAQKLGITVPRTWYPESESDLRDIGPFPVVVKAAETLAGVSYAQTPEELRTAYCAIRDRDKGKTGPLVQEYVPGSNGYGFYGFYWNGELKASYGHRRMHMYPRSGGASTMAQTCFVREVHDQGKQLLDYLRWHGVAMVEFKQHEGNGKYYLMEINPKYWGSLDLGLAAGAEFPYYHVKYAMGQAVDVAEYKRGVRYMWPEFDLLYASSGRHRVIELLKWLGRLLDPRIEKNIWLSDPGPLRAYAAYAVRWVRSKGKEEDLSRRKRR